MCPTCMHKVHAQQLPGVLQAICINPILQRISMLPYDPAYATPILFTLKCALCRKLDVIFTLSPSMPLSFCHLKILKKKTLSR